jgi:hypothetical protein
MRDEHPVTGAYATGTLLVRNSGVLSRPWLTGCQVLLQAHVKTEWRGACLSYRVSCSS